MKIDILPTTTSQECDHCGDNWGARFAFNGGICTVPLCFQCILDELEFNNFVDLISDEPNE